DESQILGNKPGDALLLPRTSHPDATSQFAEQVAQITGCLPRRDGNSWLVNCPCHESDGGQHNSSLAIFVGRDGRVVFCCRAGCPRNEIALALRSNGLALPRQISEFDRLQAAEAAEHHAGHTLELARRLWEGASLLGRYGAATSYLAERGL